MEVVVFFIELEHVVIPVDDRFGSFESYPLPDSILEAHHIVLGDKTEITVEVELLFEATFAILIDYSNLLPFPLLEVVFRVIQNCFPFPCWDFAAVNCCLEVTILHNILI